MLSDLVENIGYLGLIFIGNAEYKLEIIQRKCCHKIKRL